ncbi:uncharacterized protein Z518_08947 [Rhinocladiella mackenziei CBS 650.93]|uniref:Uncharacterized protein n=1 Tax=Rhinocladiella mackenziei CBS 650.93 TaxID=1442369 RepID=A0A0D2FGS8_9EURO|nr:uncharacterized protein Z518_08947 [Rhinocladiella mackenziei CBS 650.93]KIX01222.1 hypothetical protein Z518_08947 [Rhinocladiella mackenziei CBS 650.93]
MSTKAKDLPPSYGESVQGGLSYTNEFGSENPVTVCMKGEYRSPDFQVSMGKDALVLLQIETNSTLIYHYTDIKDLRPNGMNHTIKRKVEGDLWRYTAHGPGKDGVKLLEIETTGKIVAPGSSTRLVFRGKMDGELDALHFNSTTELKGRNRVVEVLHRSRRVGQIEQVGRDEKPEFSLSIDVARIDPLLFVVYALVLDDRLMTQRRRLRRPFGSGFAGIGKGPGAGLAGAFAVGSG